MDKKLVIYSVLIKLSKPIETLESFKMFKTLKTFNTSQAFNISRTQDFSRLIKTSKSFKLRIVPEVIGIGRHIYNTDFGAIQSVAGPISMHEVSVLRHRHLFK